MDYFIGWCVNCEKRIAPEYIYCSELCQHMDFLIETHDQTVRGHDDPTSEVHSNRLGSHPLSLKKTSSTSSSCSSVSPPTKSANWTTASSAGGLDTSHRKPTTRSVSRLEAWIVSDDASDDTTDDSSSPTLPEAAPSYNFGAPYSGMTGTLQSTRLSPKNPRSRRTTSPIMFPVLDPLMGGVPMLLNRGRNSPHLHRQRTNMAIRPMSLLSQ
ncbi:hypothetical protein BASA62_010510 [Batrachochytrium salamandrivorans]|nr:hypothetical protein BASA62_010510 [Batrachochytrium salamandrivorans]